ncbi:MAG: NAD(P)-dependent dehydrogenase (short-subunit alcohol dehydrogenase family) [Glaciecola sp.]|jgi:NAD(P)-dependent dehydrogenase (short-subunit alcohol dehydrogenase family)
MTRIASVTGETGGIAEVICKSLSEKGYNAVVNYQGNDVKSD